MYWSVLSVFSHLQSYGSTCSRPSPYHSSSLLLGESHCPRDQAASQLIVSIILGLPLLFTVVSLAVSLCLLSSALFSRFAQLIKEGEGSRRRSSFVELNTGIKILIQSTSETCIS
jgi:hypothetical protein